MIVDGEARRFRLGGARVPLGAERVDVAARRSAVVTGDLALAPTEVVDRRDVGQEVEAFLVAEVGARLDQASGIDDERRLAVRVLALDEPGDSLKGQLATPRIS